MSVEPTPPTIPAEPGSVDRTLDTVQSPAVALPTDPNPITRNRSATDPHPATPTDGGTLQTGGVLTVRQGPESSSLTVVPGYEILGELGHGGMGVVYKARQIKADRLVALKMILAGKHTDVKDRIRFQIEAESVARLVHPNIVPLFEVGEHDGLPFFSLEFCEGGSLDRKLKNWTPSPAEAADLAETLARAMHFAHLRGVIHRDLKPANVLLDAAGIPKIGDFGLAKRMDSGSDLSQSGAVMGTPAYMAPEQAAGKVKDTGPAADVYALGVILYELLAGRGPFRGETAYDVIQQVLNAEPTPPSRHRRGVPRDLETICLKCLHKDPGRRYASAEDLADDLRCWRNGEPIAARPVGRAERLVKWVKRKPALAALVAVLVVSLGLVTWQLGETRTALEQVRKEQDKRTQALANALRTADPRAVPRILEDLEGAIEDVLPRLRELWQERGEPRKQMRVGLALLPGEPEMVRDDLVAAMLAESDPEEVVLLRRQLTPYADSLREQLWKDVAETKKGFRALIALAEFDPANERWTKEAPSAVRQMLGENKLHLGTWVQALRPVRAALLNPLSEVYRDLKASAERREFAATVLADFAGDNPGKLADLLLDADPKQYAILFPVLQKDREQVVERMRREVRGEGHWNDALRDPSWSEPPAEQRREIEAADGLWHERWALCQTLPLERWEALSEGLRKCGYRPVRLRAWDQVGKLRVAAVWTRDGREWKSAVDLNRKALDERDAAMGKAGFIPADVSAYGPDLACRFAVVWVKAQQGETARLYADVAYADHNTVTNVFKTDGFVPLTVQARLGADGMSRFCGVWWKTAGTPKGVDQFLNDDEDAHIGRVLLAEKLVVDVTLNSSSRNPFASVWDDDPSREAGESHGLSISAHLERCRELAMQGYRPAALSVGGGKTVTASVWHRPYPKQDRREQLARRQATGAVTLLKMDEPADAWPLLRHRPDPEARSQFIWRSGLLGIEPKQIVERLNEEKDVSARRAFFIALGEFTEEQLPASVRGSLVEKLLGWYRDDPDPGIHGAIAWLLGHDKEGLADRPLKWGESARLKKIDEELKSRDPDGKRRWYVNKQGQTMVLIPGPVEYRMGSPLSEEGRLESETPHRRRIPRGFAIGASSVTVNEFKRFDPKHSFTKRYSPDDEGPIVSVTWYQAAQYCNWLSDQEGIPETEWCYPKHEEIKAGMKPLPDYLKRKGYRLPTEAEWEYAARAGAVTSRFYGSSLELLPRYAWFLENSKAEGGDNRAWPVGQKRPNDLGLLDMQGNVWNWVYDPYDDYPTQQGTATIMDASDIRQIKEEIRRVLRGGSFLNRSPLVRVPYRFYNAPSDRFNSLGLRLARTYD